MFNKKLIVLFLSLVLVVGFNSIHASNFSKDNCDIILTYQVGSKQYYVGNTHLEMDSEPEIKDSRIFLVIRFVLQHIPGTTLDWNGTERKVSIKTPSGKWIKLWIGNTKAEVDGKVVEIDPENPGQIAPYIKDNRTKLPMRFIGEQLNAKINWIGASRSVVLTLYDSFSCDTTLLEGCISKWSEAPNEQYQLYFHKNCDLTKESVPFFISKSLKSKTDQLDLVQYLKLKTATRRLNTKIWVTRSGEIKSWDPIPDSVEPPPEPKPPEPPAVCCDYQLFQVSQPIRSLKAGESNFYVFMLRNKCPKESKNISFQFSPISNITSISPNQLSVPPTQELMFTVFFTMPLNGVAGSQVFFSFKLTSDCSDKVEHSFTIQCDSPEVPPEPSSKKGRIIGTVSGTCNPGVTITIYDSNKGVVVWTGSTDINGYYESSSLNNCTLKCPGNYKVVPSKKNYAFSDSSKVVTFSVEDCCDPESPIAKVKKADFIGKTTADPGRIIASLGKNCHDATATVMNLSNPKEEALNLEANIKGSCDTGCNMIYGDTYRITPKKEGFHFEPEYKDVTILESCPDGITRVSFDAIESLPACCNWTFRLIPGVDQEKFILSPGETRIIELYEIANNCEEGEKEIKFAISWPKDGKIISISPTIFTLIPKQRKTIIITIKMPESAKPDESIFFPFTIIPKDCEKRDSQIVAFCKGWQCKESSLTLKVLKIDQRAGWVEGIRTVFGSPVRIYFETKSSYWSKLSFDRCFEICYDERNDSSGKLIKWGLDYREIPCPQ